jgi:hypothetical protein
MLPTAPAAMTLRVLLKTMIFSPDACAGSL